MIETEMVSCLTLRTLMACRERRRIEIGEMGARANALEQNNSYLKGLLDTRDQEKQRLAM